jgi:preprotein translocase subunit SecA
MFNFLTKGIAKVFGTKSDRDMKDLTPYIAQVNAEYAKLSLLSDDQLRQRTAELKSIIKERLSDTEDQIVALRKHINDDYDMDIHKKESIFNQIDKLEESTNQQLETILLDILPQAFAVVKETARRLKENGQLVVEATIHDRFIAAKKSNVVIDGDKAIWKNQWIAAGNQITWEMLHYDVQIIGGVVLHQGKISEMATGEGKTLVSTFPSYLNALAGRGVHIVTVNDYLAKRDCEWNAPLFEFHGLLVDCIDYHEPNTDARRKAYMADITYGTNNEFGFDYLRDNMARTPEEQVQRKHHYAMVDEVDSVLVDDARTPLIISGPMTRGNDEQMYLELKPRVVALVDAQKKICQDYLVEAKRLIAAGNTDDGGVALFRAYRGLPKSKPLIKYLSEAGHKSILQKAESYFLEENAKRMPEADAPLMFVIEEKNNSVDLTDQGINFLTGKSEDSSFFVIPDLGVKLSEIEKSEEDEHDKISQKEELIKDYSIKAERIHTIQQLLKAYTLFEKDVEYIIEDDKVKIVDEQTGRVMDGRRWSDGLHQAVEAKENVNVEAATQTYATVTLQNYFRMYHKLAGMTGTAETEAGELWEIYKLDVVVIPTNRGIVRKDEEDKIYKTVREKYNAVAQEIGELTAAGRPVLVGTTSVENSEVLSRMLQIRKIPHQVLNAKQHAREADIVAHAGKPGAVTIATNMAGRGTDIKLTSESKASGGLAIIGTERHESRRVDRQLRGRAGRQGDPGTSQFFVSLEDNLMRLFGSDRIAKVMDRMGMDDGEVIQHSMITSSIERAQKKVEENNFGMRKRLLEYDDVMNYQRTAIYNRRKNALYGDRLALDIANTLYDVCTSLVNNAGSNYDELEFRAISVLGITPPYSREEYSRLKPEQKINQFYDAVEKHYHAKNQAIAEKALPVFKDVLENRGATIEEIVVPITDGNHHAWVGCDVRKMVETEGRELVKEIEKFISLSIIDQEWKEHLRDMDDLKQSVQNAVFEQKDPLLIYKFEAVEMFQRFLSRVNFDTISFLLKADIPQEEAPIQQAHHVDPAPQPKMKTSKEDISGIVGGLSQHIEAEDVEYSTNTDSAIEKTAPRQVIKIADRNQRVTVQYHDGHIEKDVKYKKVESDVEHGLCVVIA